MNEFEAMFCRLAHLGSVANGFAGPVCFAGGLVVSGTWFPLKERTLATAFATIMGYIGAALCYIVGPLLIREPGGSISMSAYLVHMFVCNLELFNITLR